LIASNTSGSINAVDSEGDGSILKLVCCPKPTPPQTQQLVSRWKTIKRKLFTTVPVGFGRASFSNSFSFEIAGPPDPGKESDGTSVVTGPPIPGGENPPPVSMPIPGNTIPD